MMRKSKRGKTNCIGKALVNIWRIYRRVMKGAEMEAKIIFKNDHWEILIYNSEGELVDCYFITNLTLHFHLDERK